MPDTLAQPRTLPTQQRSLTIRADTFDPATLELEVVASTGARRTMFDWDRWQQVDEELAIDATAIRLDRMNNGAPVLNSHQSHELENQIGVVIPGSTRIEGGQLLARVRLSPRASIADVVADIQAGIIRNISVGYIVHEYTITDRPGERPLMRATDWEPAEISFVPVPADPGAGARSESAQGGTPCIIRRAAIVAPANPEATMPETTPVAENPSAPIVARAADPAPVSAVTHEPAVTGTVLLTAARNANLSQDDIAALQDVHAATPLTRTALMANIGERFAARDIAAPTNGRVQVTRDAGDTARAGFEDVLLSRMNARHQMTDLGRQFRGMRMIDMARDMLSQRGADVRTLVPNEIAIRALGMGTSDFPALMANVLNKRLRDQYQENQPTYMQWARRAAPLPDFKARSVAQLSGAPDLLPVNEAGEIKHGAWSDNGVSYRLATYARNTTINRHTLINDDLGALERWAVGYAAAARRLENRLVYAQLTGAGTYGGADLFTVGNANLAAAGGAIGATTLGAARTAMRVQKGRQLEELNVAPRYLIAPAALEQVALNFTSANMLANAAGSINQFAENGRTPLIPIIDAVLDGASATRWYLAADSSQIDTIEYCYLEGAEGVQLASKELGGVDGIMFEALIDFVAAAIDHRGLYANPGA
ncbi:prohead protease/major capsid protein fusion protein [Sandarakinorhabdus sp.]|uniref:prohead protease/major capsid protein fusion protein n=1 Tax=Sandarakinorhabdus sp. TaxID=1916663 RepID=UPI00286EA35A|nr:prohead protease/major capsid protein fusion protein [Sandarakinorhabdus sp.]